MRGYAYWRATCAANLQHRNCTAEQIERIVSLCVHLEAEGVRPHPGVWHVASVVTDTVAKCACFPCTAQRKRAGGTS